MSDDAKLERLLKAGWAALDALDAAHETIIDDCPGICEEDLDEALTIAGEFRAALKAFGPERK